MIPTSQIDHSTQRPQERTCKRFSVQPLRSVRKYLKFSHLTLHAPPRPANDGPVTDIRAWRARRGLRWFRQLLRASSLEESLC